MEHRPERKRFVMPTDAGDAYIAYEERGEGVLDLQHTVVPAEEQGGGVGSELVEQVLEYAREHHLRIVPTCPFVAAWLSRHPEFEELVVRE